MVSNPYLKPPAFYVGRGCGKTMTHLMMCLEYLRIRDMFEYLNKYRGVALPKVDLTGVVREYYQGKNPRYDDECSIMMHKKNRKHCKNDG